MSGLWECNYALGNMPHSREGGSGCLIGDDLYIFGGFSRDLFGDLRVLNTDINKWKLLNLHEKSMEAASAR